GDRLARDEVALDLGDDLLVDQGRAAHAPARAGDDVGELLGRLGEQARDLGQGAVVRGLAQPLLERDDHEEALAVARDERRRGGVVDRVGQDEGDSTLATPSTRASSTSRGATASARPAVAGGAPSRTSVRASPAARTSSRICWASCEPEPGTLGALVSSRSKMLAPPVPVVARARVRRVRTAHTPIVVFGWRATRLPSVANTRVSMAPARGAVPPAPRRPGSWSPRVAGRA